MSVLDVIALLVPVLLVSEITLLILRPELIKNIASKFYGSPMLVLPIALLAGIIVLYFLVKDGVTPVQLLAMLLFSMMLMLASFASFSKELVPMLAKIIDSDSVLKRAAPAYILWGVLSLWLIYYLFARQ